jgi:hypothetical protein
MKNKVDVYEIVGIPNMNMFQQDIETALLLSSFEIADINNNDNKIYHKTKYFLGSEKELYDDHHEVIRIINNILKKNKEDKNEYEHIKQNLNITIKIYHNYYKIKIDRKLSDKKINKKFIKNKKNRIGQYHKSDEYENYILIQFCRSKYFLWTKVVRTVRFPL